MASNGHLYCMQWCTLNVTPTVCTLSSELKYPLDCLVDLTWYENLLGKQQDQRPTSP